MKTIKLLSFILLFALAFSCSKDDDGPSQSDNDNTPVVSLNAQSASGFGYKVFFQETASPQTRKGLVILAHGDNSDEADGTLNSQCEALAKKGYVAVTTSYRNPTGTYEEINARFKGDIESMITAMGGEFQIPRNKTIIGGLSRGGNNTFPLILPGQPGVGNPITDIRGAILECSGGDEWKGSAVLVPVAYMANKVDPTMGVENANDFKNGLLNNANGSVAQDSECLIINSSGHCTSSGQYKNFVVEKVMEWLP
ncbi:alpha/beta hydrolase family protein [Flavobacterium selenitireducens]|uniref:alpha/beta hydrolase family protein n=1 Tax=Flavobacterium selenitireducens TaxID=2722704 RepID=UPI00168B8A11|nr:hypothetical protein [Flavobacterium selenitireducens]MBD3583192.1 hypothetical protein [Flavobacterium selenitireducens]